MKSRKIIIIVLATAIFAMCIYMFGLEKPANQPAESPAFSVGDFVDWVKTQF